MRFLLLLLLAASATPAAANRVYSGEEASAIRCSNTVAFTAVALANAELIGQEQKEVMLGITVLILERHVSGTWREKKAAMQIMRDRRNLDDTLEDYQRNAARCLQRFPIN